MNDSIKIAGTDYPIKWNFRAVAAYEKSTDESAYAIQLELAKAFTDNTNAMPQLKMTVVAGLVYASIIGGGSYISEELVFEQISKNKIPQDVFVKVMSLYYDAMPKADPDQAAAPSDNTASVGERTGQPSKDGLA